MLVHVFSYNRKEPYVERIEFDNSSFVSTFFSKQEISSLFKEEARKSIKEELPIIFNIYKSSLSGRIDTSFPSETYEAICIDEQEIKFVQFGKTSIFTFKASNGKFIDVRIFENGDSRFSVFK